MRHWRKAALLLACGAGCSLLSATIPVVIEPYLPEAETKQSTPVVRLPLTPAAFPDPSAYWVKRRIGLVHESAIRGIGIEDSWHTERLSTGWPFLMLEGGDYCEFHNTGGRPASAEMHPTWMYQWHGGKRFWQFPVCPRSWECVGNMAFWTSACSVLAWSVPALRRWRRRATRRCETCGYPATDAGPCPECGTRRA